MVPVWRKSGRYTQFLSCDFNAILIWEVLSHLAPKAFGSAETFHNGKIDPGQFSEGERAALPAFHKIIVHRKNIWQI